jgi:hypothetical protein
MSRSMVRLLIFLGLFLTPSSASGWDYVPYNGDPMGYLSGGTPGTLYRDEPNEINNMFSPDSSGGEQLYFDDDENHSSGEVYIKVEHENGCTWYLYQGTAKFSGKYFLGQPIETHAGNCNKP